MEYLPGQFDQRAASAEECVRLIEPTADIRIRSSRLMVFDSTVSEEDLEHIRHYVINNVYSREKNLDQLGMMENPPDFSF